MARRIRTESMIDRLGKKPLSEGFDLWDKDYTLGALRLLQCKLDAQQSQGMPPYEVAQALDAVGEIMNGLDEPEEAQENYALAADKYDMIQKKVLAELMHCKAAAMKDAAAGMERVQKFLAPFDESGQPGDAAKNQESALGRFYFYRAQLNAAAEKPEEALKDVARAIELNADRVHLAHNLQGQLLQEQGKVAEAVAAFRKAAGARPVYVPALEALVLAQKEAGDVPGALDTIERAMALHPQATLIREKAFLLSEKGDDAAALEVIDKAIEQPPHEETETLSKDCGSEATLYKAKAAILADLKRFPEALAAVDAALKCDPEDDETTAMRKHIAECQ
eukprot:TRINITY_DN6249_c0_g1_i1.p1 TRINITY_DN6249_c0_g1~~TRINITY_DN6249_c0_g1_i1.p1  ORF type:complete len:366 (+),score=173.42 TRINITY_DN6249_c0_g1_i1:92-1099(+)